MFIQRAFGKELDEEQVIALLNNEKILLKGIQSKKGTTYDAYLEPIGIREFSYEKDGETKKGKQFAFNMEFPETEVE